MAKSLRSKWRRKCRAVKRVRYGQKELDRLKKTLGIDESKNEIVMKDVFDNATVVDAKTIAKETAALYIKEENGMETDEKKRKFNPKTLKDESGTYPIWMHQRKVKAIKSASKKGAKNAKKKK